MKQTIHSIIGLEIETRMIDAGIKRIITCIEKLEEDQLYFRPNENSNSINNQVLHLDGNVRQWLVSTMTNTRDNRSRDKEFDPLNRKSKSELLQILYSLEEEIKGVIPQITNVDLTASQDVQCHHLTNLSILIHVIEHFSYHVGQITYITKMVLDIDTGYYNGKDLGRVN